MNWPFGRGCLGVCLVLVPMSAVAVLNAVDVAPAATLLLPYFEVDLAADGRTTLITIHNFADDPVIAHATIYTDLAVSSVAFDIDLEALESTTLDLADIFLDNSLALGVDTPNPGGDLAVPVAAFADGFESGDLTAWSAVKARKSYDTLQEWHSGNLSVREGYRCGGSQQFDVAYRGFMFIDVVSEQGAGFQDEPGYFVSGGLGLATNANVLTGEFELRDSANNYSQGNPLVHIEAGTTNGLDVAGNYTFYSRFNNFTATDNREPIGSAFGARFTRVFPLNLTEFIYWRDPKMPIERFVCGTVPFPYPLDVASLVVYDEETNAEMPSGLAAFPWACGKVAIGAADLPSSFNAGWIEVDFNNVAGGGVIAPESQGALFYAVSASGRVSTSQSGVVLDHASSANP